ncbi:MAG: hypothetical protein J6S85_08890, partial [Methanobrevibacter sp.]|nr:hypothetical protein [Methanobrevibacter sp.]
NLPYTNINNIKSQKISAKTSNKPQQLILKRAITEEHFLPLNNYNIQLEIISLVLKIKCSSVLPILTQI